VSYRPDAHLSKVPAVRTMCHIVRRPIYSKHHPSGLRELPVQTFPCVKKFRNAPSCIRPDVSVACLDDSQCSTKLQDFFPKHRSGKITATVRMRLSILQVSHSKSRRSDASQHGPDVLASNIEIAYIKSTVRTTIPPVRMQEAFIWKSLAVEV
jgi:hypothetical protein